MWVLSWGACCKQAQSSPISPPMNMHTIPPPLLGRATALCSPRRPPGGRGLGHLHAGRERGVGGGRGGAGGGGGGGRRGNHFWSDSVTQKSGTELDLVLRRSVKRVDGQLVVWGLSGRKCKTSSLGVSGRKCKTSSLGVSGRKCKTSSLGVSGTSVRRVVWVSVVQV